MNLFKALKGTKTGANDQITSKVINAKQFLGKEAGQSYYDPEAFFLYGDSLRDVEAQQLEQAFEFALSGYPLVGALIKRVDKADRPYVMANFEVSRGVVVPLKIIVEGNMLQFLKDLQQRKVAINFSLAELIEVAMND